MTKCGCNYNSDEDSDDELNKGDHGHSEKEEKIMPRIFYYIFFTNNMLMTISVLLSPILLYYTKNMTDNFLVECFNPYKLLFLVSFNMLNVALKLIILEKLNSYKCCVKRLYDFAFVYSSCSTKKLNKNIQTIIRNFLIVYISFISLLSIILVQLNILTVLECTNDDYIGFMVTRMLIISTASGILFNFFEIYMFYSLIILKIFNFKIVFIFQSLNEKDEILRNKKEKEKKVEDKKDNNDDNMEQIENSELENIDDRSINPLQKAKKID